jgi:hypothetical protein
MTFEDMGVGALDYDPCCYGDSKLQFRGPQKRLDGPYWAVLGNSEAYGKFVEEPYPVILEQLLKRPVVNFGFKNAGIDVFLLDPTVIAICAAAEVTIVQVMGAQNLSNSLYSVHPRRNDRFLSAGPRVQKLFGDVDLTDIHYTRHFLNRLKESSDQEFAIVRDELKSAWVDKMQTLLSKLSGRVILLWMADHAFAEFFPEIATSSTYTHAKM